MYYLRNSLRNILWLAETSSLKEYHHGNIKKRLMCKEIQPVHSEGDQPWDFFGGNDAEAETLVLWPPHAKSWLIGKDWCWEGLGAGGEGDNRGWDGWMASLTRWTWVWMNSRSLWRTRRPGVLGFMGSQRVGHDWATELNYVNSIGVVHHYINFLLWVTDDLAGPKTLQRKEQNYSLFSYCLKKKMLSLVP